jgi:hypothetical protein
VSLNTPEEKNILAKSLGRTNDRNGVLESLRFIADHRTPFALYVATLDRSNTMWVFDPETVYDMLGGEDIHDKTFRSVFPDHNDRQDGILFYVLTKTSPIVVIKLSLETICWLIDTLEADMP